MSERIPGKAAPRAAGGEARPLKVRLKKARSLLAVVAEMAATPAQ